VGSVARNTVPCSSRYGADNGGGAVAGAAAAGGVPMAATRQPSSTVLVTAWRRRVLTLMTVPLC